MSTKILIVDDHPVATVGIRSILQKDDSIEIIGEASCGKEALAFVHDKNPDIIIMDVSTPEMSGIVATKEILKILPDVKIIALSIHSGQKFVEEMLDTGASGYLLKEEAPDELIMAIKKVTDGDSYLSASIVKVAMEAQKTDNEGWNIPVLKTKLLRPNVFSSYLERKDVIDELEANVHKPLSLISAGAGYGKSITVSQWLDRSNRLHGWISLDEEHNDLRVFLLYLIQTFENIIPGSMIESNKAVSGPHLPSTSELTRILFIDLCDIEIDSILVLDDYHKIHKQDIHDFLTEWLRFPPPSIHLSILTRRDPFLTLNSYRLNGRMTEIRMDNLSFSLEETIQYFSENLKIDLDRKAFEVLHKKTEGWIIALILASILLKKSEDFSNLIRDIEGNLGSVSEYLVIEVLSKLPDKLMRTLLVTSLFDRFCSELIDELLEEDEDIDGHLFIRDIRNLNLFLVDLDLVNKWFRYHHLFQSILQNLLRERFSKEEISKIHLKASRWFENHLLLEEAIDHAVIVKDYERAGRIIKKYRLHLIEVANYNRLERLLRKIPNEIVESDPELLIIEFHIEWNYDDFMRLGVLEEKMEKIIDRMEKDTLVEGEYIFFTGFTAFFLQNDIKKALSLFDIAYNKIPEKANGSMGLIDLISLIFMQFGGLYDKAHQIFSNLINTELTHLRKFRLYEGFIAASIDEANMEAAAEIYPAAIAHALQSKLPDAISGILYLAANYLMRSGKVSEALKYLKEVVEIRYLAHARVATDAMSSLMICYCLMDDNQKALNVLSLFDRYTANLTEFHRSLYWSAKMRYYLMNEDRGAVKEALSQYNTHVLNLVTWLDVPEITYSRALIFEGSTQNLNVAEEELIKLEAATNAVHNRIHLYEVKALQAVLYFKKGDLEKAKEALLESFEIAEPEGLFHFFIELGESFLDLVDQLPLEIRNKTFMRRIRDQIYDQQNERIKKEGKTEKVTLNPLTKKELKVLRHVADGLRNQEIAEKLFNSEWTIKKHIYNMFQKLSVKNRLSLVIKAKEEGILE